MRDQLFFGANITIDELEKEILTIDKKIFQALKENFDIDLFISLCHHFSTRLQCDSLLRELLKKILIEQDQLKSSEVESSFQTLIDFMSEKELRKKLVKELGTDTPFSMKKDQNKDGVFEAYSPLGVILQITPSNDSLLPILSALEGLLSGNINILKLSSHSSDFSRIFFQEFIKENLDFLGSRIAILKFSSQRKKLLESLMLHLDALVAWGGEEAISELKRLTPEKVKFIDWGHKISFSYVSSKAKQELTPDLLKSIVNDIFIYNQQACSSPQCLYLEDASSDDLKHFATLLHNSIKENLTYYKFLKPSSMEAAEIQKTVLVVEAQRSLPGNQSAVIKDAHGRWRLLVDDNPGLRASPLYGTLWIKSIKRDQIMEVLRPLRSYLQTVGLSCALSEVLELKQLFYQSGVNRIKPLGQMHDSYTGEPHDGYSALVRYTKKISLDSVLPELKSFYQLDDLKQVRLNEVEHQICQLLSTDKLMTKEDFQKIKPPLDTQLFFKSGGSSGEPKISYFTYHDYHLQMEQAANGLIAAGLNVNSDLCMNLFFGGGLYGGFLSFYTILEKINACQLPMSAHMDFKFVAQMIVRYKVNVLLGMPSYILLLLEENKNLFKESPVIQKIFYGGEHFSDSQKKYLLDEFGIKIVRSASYGSVDMGPLGFQCEHSDGKIHHLNQNLHKLEIFSLENHRKIENEEMGKLVFSTTTRSGQNLIRYDVGDLGRWVQAPCSCGRKSPRFELLGRSGDVFRVSGSFINYNKLQKIVNECLSSEKDFQVIIKKNEEDPAKEKLILVLDKEYEKLSLMLKMKIINEYSDINEVINYERTVDLDLVFMSQEEMVHSKASGKLVRVIDQRL
ncbi:MAG: hypothetical protein HUU56_01375 [Bdellovibrionaceae bacterium]|nr:hypothetical protein [Pseudobdellovibrionaceae bacterium]